VAKQKITVSLYEFSNFFWVFLNFFFLFIHVNKKNVSGVNIWSFPFFLTIKQKKYKENIFVNSGYFKSKQEFSIFPLFFFVKPS
jgi:hypothetical protein